MKKSLVVFAFIACVFFTACDKNDQPEDQYTILSLKECEYEKARFFFLDTCYRNQFEVYSNRIHTFISTNEIINWKIYKFSPVYPNDSLIIPRLCPGKAAYGNQTDVYVRDFLELDCGGDYYLDTRLGILSLHTPINRGEILTVFYITKDSVFHGNVSGDTLQLKLIWTPEPNPSELTWQLELKNVYDFGIRSLENNEAENFFITFTKPGTDPVRTIKDRNNVNQNLLRLLHIDVSGPKGSPAGKGDVGDSYNYGIDMQNGLIIFPKLRPFDPDDINLNGFFAEAYPDSFSGHNVRMKDIYDLERTDPNLQNMMSNFLFTLSIKIYRP